MMGDKLTETAEALEAMAKTLERQADTDQYPIRQFALRASALEHRRRALQMRRVPETDIAAAFPSSTREWMHRWAL